MAVAEITLHLDLSEANALSDFLADFVTDENDLKDYDILKDIQDSIEELLS